MSKTVLLYRLLRAQQLWSVIGSEAGLAKQFFSISRASYQTLTHSLVPLKKTLFPLLAKPGRTSLFENFLEAGYSVEHACYILLDSNLEKQDLLQLYRHVNASKFAVLLKSFPVYFEKVVNTLEYLALQSFQNQEQIPNFIDLCLDKIFQRLVLVPTGNDSEQFKSLIAAGISARHCSKIDEVCEDDQLEVISQISPVLDADLLVFFMESHDTLSVLAKENFKPHLIKLQEIIRNCQVAGEEIIRFIAELSKKGKIDLVLMLIERPEILTKAIMYKHGS